MHKYLSAIGLSSITDSDKEKQLLELCVEQNDAESLMTPDMSGRYGELRRFFTPEMGIATRGEVNEDYFEYEYYYPFLIGKGTSTYEDVVMERTADRECYLAACDDGKIGVTIIFYLQNAIECLLENKVKPLDKRKTSLTLSALSIDGKILLPVRKNPEAQAEHIETSRKRSQLVNEARKGDPEAMETLTMDDMDTYSAISRRLKEEDILSIVDTSFMPFGMESDKYQIIAEILEVEKKENEITKEQVYLLQVSCNDLVFDLCINEKDLMGEPAVGRRFKGIIWLQGYVNFLDKGKTTAN